MGPPQPINYGPHHLAGAARLLATLGAFLPEEERGAIQRLGLTCPWWALVLQYAPDINFVQDRNFGVQRFCSRCRHYLRRPSSRPPSRSLDELLDEDIEIDERCSWLR